MIKTNSIKILLIGDSGTGKTNLISRFTRDNVNLKTEPTNGVDFHMHDIQMDQTSVNISIWDFAGQEKYRPLMNSYLFNDTVGILLVYDMTDYVTFENLTRWYKDLTQWTDSTTVIKLVGNKNDLEHQRTVPRKEAEQFAIDHGLSFIETSALNGHNVTMTFQCIIKEIHVTTTNLLYDSLSISNHNIKSDEMKDIFKGSWHNENQSLQQPETFHIVLIDLKRASERQIYCVEKPLDDENLKYVALSYRWGELEETVIDTKIGYTAAITSFNLNDFCTLCHMMTMETDLKNMDYIWVDALCVNQMNYEQRKATIYQMTDIYEHASYIVAVPDLHMKHLANISLSNRNIMFGSNEYGLDLYHLIHGNIELLAFIENKWLDHYNVPGNPELRELIKSSTDHFAYGFMNHTRRHRQHTKFNAEKCLRHIYKKNLEKKVSDKYSDTNNDDEEALQTLMVKTDYLHSRPILKYPNHAVSRNIWLPEWRRAILQHQTHPNDKSWKQLVRERSQFIQQSMYFMADLINDWSTRVWVISEFNIAKKKNNLKYWFLQLGDMYDIKDLTFFKFDFQDVGFSNVIQRDVKQDHTQDYEYNNPVYIHFHKTMLRQLNQQSFFEMMLNSKARRNEDRFYAIFPLSEYKNKITNKAEVDSWKINTFTSVKLKLYQVMNTKDKLNLLFSSGNRISSHLGEALPTFSTSSIHFTSCPMEHFTFNTSTLEYNFDLDCPSTITLCQSDIHANHSTLFYLNLKPKEYFVCDIQPESVQCIPMLWNRCLYGCPTHIVCIPSIKQAAMITHHINIDFHHDMDWDHHIIFLIGDFTKKQKNVWTLADGLRFHYNPEFAPYFRGWTRYISKDNTVGFNIY